MKGRDSVSEVNYSLEVKEGDKLELDVNVFFVADQNSETFPGLIGFLASSFGVSNGIGSETAHIYDGLENASNLLALSLTNSPNAPRAYLMCMVFDKDYVLIDPTAGGYDFYTPVPEAAATETQNISLEIDIPENAKYIYTYVANESAGTNVFFDDFTVKQLGVDITQTTDYYPFGSVLSHWQKENYRFGYQGEYSEEDEETGFNHFEARVYDSKIGRWLVPDPSKEFYSPYRTGNNPINKVDPDGRCEGCPTFRQLTTSDDIKTMIKLEIQYHMDIGAQVGLDAGLAGFEVDLGSYRFIEFTLNYYYDQTTNTVLFDDPKTHHFLIDGWSGKNKIHTSLYADGVFARLGTGQVRTADEWVEFFSNPTWSFFGEKKGDWWEGGFVPVRYRDEAGNKFIRVGMDAGASAILGIFGSINVDIPSFDLDLPDKVESKKVD